MEERDQIISLMYEAAINPALWPRALAVFADATQSIELTFVVAIPKETGPDTLARFIFMTGRMWDWSTSERYYAHYAKINPLNVAIAKSDPGGLLICQEHITDVEVCHSEFYQDFLMPIGGRYMGGWVLENTPTNLMLLALHRRRTRFERAEFAPWEAVAQHARHAVSLSSALAPRLAAGEVLREAIDHRQMACIMVDSNARVFGCSSAATALLESGNVLRLRSRSQLTALACEDTRRLHNLIASAATGRAGGMLRLSGNWIIQIVPGGVSQQNPFDPRFADCALVFIIPPIPPSPHWSEIQVALDCTRAESEVAADLASGIDPTEIATKRNVSINTVRTQIRSLLERTGFHRVAELVSFLVRIE